MVGLELLLHGGTQTQKRDNREERDLGDLKALEENGSLGSDQQEEKRKERTGTKCCDVHVRRSGGKK